jgi:peroxiredoxin (alkyl hydroperoxide reductase subunit C)
MAEILRVVKALQTTDEHGVATPANWEPGSKIIMPPPKSAEAADQRVAEKGMECTDWYFCKREL